MEVDAGVPLLRIYLETIQAHIRVRLEESEVAKVIREAVKKGKMWI